MKCKTLPTASFVYQIEKKKNETGIFSAEKRSRNCSYLFFLSLHDIKIPIKMSHCVFKSLIYFRCLLIRSHKILLKYKLRKLRRQNR